MNDIKYITSDSELDFLVFKLKKSNQIAIDLEFDNNHHHYGFSLCLMQLYCGTTAYLVDPLKIDISRIFPFLEDDKIRKVVFSFGEDIRLLHGLGCKPKNIYDISIAIKLLDYEKVSLADALERNMNINLEKGSQKSDWCRRPFSEKQKIYAAHDVIHLLELQKKIESQALSKKVSEWIEEENLAFEKHIQDNSIGNIIKKKDRYKMTEFEWFFYQKLWNLREKEAKKLDKPAHQVINNEFLKEITFNPELIRNWKNNKNIHHGIKTDYFGRVLSKIYKDAKLEAKEQNISKTKKEIKHLSKDEYGMIKQKKRESDIVKEEIFKPIQKQIANDFGENAARFILSNKQIDIILNGKTILDYKRKLFMHYANLLNLEINKYLFFDKF